VTGVTQSAAVATFDSPFALSFLPDGRMLVTQRSSTYSIADGMSLVTQAGVVTKVAGLPTSIGMLDVKLAPDYASSGMIYFSYMVQDTTAARTGRGAGDATLFPQRVEVARGKLTIVSGQATLSGTQVIFRQNPTIVSLAGSGEPGGRITFSPNGQDLYISSGDRQELDPTFLFATSNNIGKIIRIHPDGSIPTDNPFVSTAGALGEIYTLGHRNPYGLAFAPDGTLWESEMGPMGGDELNVIKPGLNYGWPAVSYGDNYDGSPIPKPAAGDGYEASKLWWTPVIAPTGMIFYSGDVFGDWKGDIILTGLQSQGLVRVRVTNGTAKEMQRISLGARTRDIAQAPDGSLWVITDGATGQLKKLTPVF
jgi:glucose/arabinose dehydrogenase